MSRSTHRATVRLRVAAALTLGLVATTFGQLTPASAVPPDMPVGLAVNQPDSTTTILSWEHVPNATRYAVTVNGATTSTVNNSFVPSQALPEGNLDWSVTAFAGTEAGPTASGSFSSTRLAAPVLSSPSSNAVLAQPTNPPLLGTLGGRHLLQGRGRRRRGLRRLVVLHDGEHEPRRPGAAGRR
jgi:hypothetical protein